jgi:uncharacterized membrane protein YkvA (DUF1232 family)
LSLKEKAKIIKTNIPTLFIALRRKDTPLVAKILAGITVGYALSPIDIVPDFVPVLGYLDDIIILPLLILWTVRLIPSEIFAECKLEAEGMWKHGKPKKWYYALPIIVLYLLIIWWIVSRFLT